MTWQDWVALLFVPFCGLLYWWLVIRRRRIVHFKKGMVVSIAGQERTVTKVNHRTKTITVDKCFFADSGDYVTLREVRPPSKEPA